MKSNDILNRDEIRELMQKALKETFTQLLNGLA